MYIQQMDSYHAFLGCHLFIFEAVETVVFQHRDNGISVEDNGVTQYLRIQTKQTYFIAEYVHIVFIF